MEKQLFLNNWEFVKMPLSYPEANALEDSDMLSWKPVDLPHDWLIGQVNDLYEPSLGLYRKKFTLEVSPDQVYALRFEGVYFNCTVYVNGQLIGIWRYGYSTFEFDITDALHNGTNQVLIAVHHESPNSRWYSGAGIYRPVYFLKRNKIHIASDGVYFSSVKTEGGYQAVISTELEGMEQETSLSVQHEIFDTNQHEFFDTSQPETTNYVNKTSYSVSSVENGSITLDCPNVSEWDIDDPHCYRLRTTLLKEGVVLDEVIQTIGFRSVYFTPEGFFLNGRKRKLHGVCLHHDLGCLGAAVNKTALRRQLMSMKEMGANAVRTSHNMPSAELMELCDELGILVDSEAFDMWQKCKTEYDYARFFDDCYEKDIKSWIKRDRNHPSVIMWSIGNEIYDTHTNPDAPRLTAAMRDLVLTYDPRRNGHVTIGSNYIPWEGAQKCADQLKLSGYNYCEYLYEEHHAKFPDHILYGSETAARVHSRGIYHFPIEAAAKTCIDKQCSSLENSRMGAGDRTPQDNIIWDRDCEFSCGQFIWTGADYIGEPTPYQTKNAYYGSIDTAGFPKDSYYLYQACWSDKPVLHLFPYWDFNEGQLVDVCAYTNFPQVELFVNGRSYGVQNVDVLHGKNLMAVWKVPYEPGEIRAVAYDAQGKTAMEDSRHSFGDAASLVVTADKNTLLADGTDMIFLTISAKDQDGFPVENANNRVTVSVSGAARLVGLDSGDSTDYEEYKGTSKKLFSGKLAAYLMAKDFSGEITVTVSSPGLDDARLLLYAKEAVVPDGISCLEENCETTPMQPEIPIRKIALSATARSFTKTLTTAVVTADIFPKNASDSTICWEAVTLEGVKTNIASIEADGKQCTVSALGDGTFKLRCMAYNNKPDPEVLSELLFESTGLGTAVLDPYQFIYGSLCRFYDTEPGVDLEGGISLMPGSYVGFQKVDFGAGGADTFHLPLIFWFSENILQVELWDGAPDLESSVKLGSGSYQHAFVWMTYFDLTITTKEKLYGTHDIYFKFFIGEGVEAQKISLKGFSCDYHTNAYDRIPATNYLSIYGDSFTIEKDAVTHIGNNVSLEFDSFDFTEGVSSVTICGRTHHETDSLHILFLQDSGKIRRLAEFSGSEEFVTKTFPLEPFAGKYKITFMCLPGSDFDFAWFQFNR